MIVLSDNKSNPDEEYDYLVEQGKLPATSVVLPHGHLSVSQVNSWLRCGRAYEFRYVKGIIMPPLARMAEGTAVHKALEVAHRERRNSGTVAPLSVLTDAHNDMWKELAPDVEVYDEDESESVILSRGRIFLEKYHTAHLPHLHPLGIEKRFWVTVGQQNIPVLGYIDLIANDSQVLDTQEEVIDYKVTNKTISQVDIDSNLQLTVYAYATKIPHVRFDMFVKTKVPQVKIAHSERAPEHWKWAEQVFEGVTEAITKGVFPPADPSRWQCTPRHCGYWSRCRGGL